MDKHRDFILSPISNVLEEVVAANAGIGKGIETFPLSEYVLQSAFLKMTGFQEQKMKCIVWDLATNDYEYRYSRYTLKPLGECSSYDEKKIIYKDLIELIKRSKPGFLVAAEVNKTGLAITTLATIKDIFAGTNLSTWAQQNYQEFLADNAVIPANQFATENNLFENILQGKYALLYKHRNRCAHNTLSYQENLPTLKTLLKSNFKDDNYFVRFTLLVLIDQIFIELYNKYIELVAFN